MTVTVKDLFHEFAPERAPDAVPIDTVVSPAPGYDGATALVVCDFLDSVAALCGVLEEESACIASGALDRLEVYAHRKAAMAEQLEGAVGRARADGIRLPDELRAMMLERVERLDRAVSTNASGLVALRKAVLTINRNLLTALERAASDGTYARDGLARRPVELSASGLNATL